MTLVAASVSRRSGAAMMTRLAAVAAVAAALLMTDIRADSLGKQCFSNADCPSGATCVAGDSEIAVQRCVAGTPCGGSTLGNCPGDETSGQLACIWRPDPRACAKSPGGCKEIDGQLGIYKCISLDRCDQYLEGQCSASCNVDGKQCNGRGNCQLVSDAGDTPQFQCACEMGWNGTRCETVVGDSCMVDVGQCGDNGKCVDGACECKNGYTGVQCEVPPKTSLSASGSGIDGSVSSASTDGTKTPQSSGSKNPQGSGSKKDGGPNAATTSAPPSAEVDAQGGKADAGSSSVGTIIAIIVAVVVVAALLFVVYSRKKRRQQQEQETDGTFNRANSVSEPAAPTGPPTPKQNIVIM